MAVDKQFDLMEHIGKQTLLYAVLTDLALTTTNDMAGKYVGFNNIEAFGKPIGKLFRYSVNCAYKAISALDRLFEFTVSKFDQEKTTAIKCGDDIRSEAYDIWRLILLWENATTNQPRKRIKEIEDMLNAMCDPKDRVFSKKYIDSLKLSA